jgi:hypothetical protein
MSYQSKKDRGLLVIAMLLLACISCHRYYKATHVNAAGAGQTAGSIDSLKKLNRYFILRNGNGAAYAMTDFELSADQKTLDCRLEGIPPEHGLHLLRGVKGKMQYRKSTVEGLAVLNEVHFYINRDTAAREGRYTLQLDRVQKIEVIEHDSKRTTNSYVIGAIGYTIGAVAVVGIIAAALKSSCPFVSAYDGDEFRLQGEIFGGSIYPQLARHDYLPLRMKPMEDGSLQLKISNELQEKQFTDLAELWVVNHDRQTKVIADEQGNLYSITAPQAPVRASLNDRKDVLTALLRSGDQELLYLDDSSRPDASNEVHLQFQYPQEAKTGRLLLSLKNSYWLDLMYGELARGFGTYYATYMQEQKSRSALELLKWVREQQIPLKISVKTTRGWKEVATITTVGPLATREIAVPVDLADAAEPLIEIRLSSGFMFWEIDQVAMDFGRADQFTVQKLSPVSAIDQRGLDVAPRLQKEDGIFLEQPEIGNVATIAYKPVTPVNPPAQTYILHTKGYYEHIRDFRNKPDPVFLGQFRNPNAFPLYGMKRYKQVNQESLRLLTAKN